MGWFSKYRQVLIGFHIMQGHMQQPKTTTVGNDQLRTTTKKSTNNANKQTTNNKQPNNKITNKTNITNNQQQQTTNNKRQPRTKKQTTNNNQPSNHHPIINDATPPESTRPIPWHRTAGRAQQNHKCPGRWWLHPCQQVHFPWPKVHVRRLNPEVMPKNPWKMNG